jgi:hypothetical protein
MNTTASATLELTPNESAHAPQWQPTQVAEARRPDPRPTWQRAPREIAARPVALNRAKALPFVEDEIVGQPHPDPISGQGMEAPIGMPMQQGMPMQGMPMQQGMPQPYMDGGMQGETVYEGDMGQTYDGYDAYDGDYGEGWDSVDSFFFNGSQVGYDVMACERFHPCSWLSFLNEASVFSGVQGFTNPVDRGVNGNFGFYQGVNVGDVLWHRRGLGYQIGASYGEVDLNGTPAFNTTNQRNQTFITAGLFHRAFYGRGLQGGVVFDYLNDTWFQNVNLSQMRFEISWVGARGNEFGYWGTSQTRTNSIFVPAGGNNVNARVQPMQLNTFFYRRTRCDGGQGRLWGGFATDVFGSGNTGTTCGIVGGDFRMPLSNRIDFVGGYNYVLPTAGGRQNAFQEAWGLNIGVAFYPGRCRVGRHNGPYRPLFEVANNNSFMLDNRPQGQ